FIGVGDVADYAKRRLEQLQTEFPDLDVYVVSPSIVSDWNESVWATLLPELDAGRRIGKTADEFLDELARAWAVDLPDQVQAAAAIATGAILDGIGRSLTALRTFCGVDAIAWARSAAFRCRLGTSAVRHPPTEEAVMAIGVLAGERGAEVRVLPSGRC